MKKALIGLAVLSGIAFVPALPATQSVAASAGAAMLLQEGWVRIENRWRPGEYIHVERGLAIGGIQPGWHSAIWAIDDLGDGHVRIGNRWREGDYLHIENGRLESGPIEAGWHSAEWVIEPAGEGYVRLRNRWRSDRYIHVEHGRLEAGTIRPGWHSAMWTLSQP